MECCHVAISGYKHSFDVRLSSTSQEAVEGNQLQMHQKNQTPAITEFDQISGLSANASESEFFFAGVQVNLKQQILHILKFMGGHLPVRYLGVPLISVDHITGLIRKQVKTRIEIKGPYHRRPGINTKICIRWDISEVLFHCYSDVVVAGCVFPVVDFGFLAACFLINFY
ncbi:hypothetical protein SO802_020115 [Lithocarpus litseifolius]|uniref:Uncharacterized protein n=1 Tax=Lithocarpus litseifolius TaxID=425828 RepID=A0AAW2CE27_9ROSI